MSLKKKVKIQLKVLIRCFTDILHGKILRFTSTQIRSISHAYSISVKQEIKPSQSFENKKFNLELAAQRVSKHHILPQQIFSFWKAVGNPDHGFKTSRSIQQGKVIQDVGGGVCQVSGLIYHVSLLAGLDIEERHNHSIDLYTDETRFSPLGLDATVVFGYKDLRIQNKYPFPIKFEFLIGDHTIEIRLLSTEEIALQQLNFDMIERPDFKVVNVKNQDGMVLNESRYGVLKVESL